MLIVETTSRECCQEKDLEPCSPVKLVLNGYATNRNRHVRCKFCRVEYFLNQRTAGVWDYERLTEKSIIPAYEPWKREMHYSVLNGLFSSGIYQKSFKTWVEDMFKNDPMLEYLKSGKVTVTKG